MIKVLLTIVTTILIILISCSTEGATLDTSITVAGVNYSPIPLEGGTQNVKTNPATGFYNFADRNGDGSMVAVTPSGLNLAGFILKTAQPGVTRPLSLNLNGGNLTATTGYIEMGTTVNDPGDLTIYNVGTIAMQNGFIRVYAYVGGDIYIGQNGIPAGAIQINGIRASYTYDGGYVTIYGTGDVLIASSAGVSADINNGGPGGYSTTGGIAIRHDGRLLVRTVYNVGYVYGTQDVLFDGDFLVNGASGTFTASSLQTQNTNPTWGYGGSTGSITVRNYTDATIGSVSTYNLNGGATGPLLVTGIVDKITITGSMDLRNGAGTKGTVRLFAGGVISFNALNLSLLQYVGVDSGGNGRITGLLTGTDGNPASGLGNIGAALRAPSSDVIYYSALDNTALTGKAIRLANLAGTAGAGGRLVPYLKDRGVPYYSNKMGNNSTL